MAKRRRNLDKRSRSPQSNPIVEYVSSTVKEASSRIKAIKKVLEASLKERGEMLKEIGRSRYPHLNIPYVKFENYFKTKIATIRALVELNNAQYLDAWYDNTRARAAETLIMVGYSRQEIEKMLDNPASSISRLWKLYFKQKKENEDFSATRNAIKMFTAMISIKELMAKPIEEGLDFFLDIAAKETHFDQSKKSPTGPVGAYQLTGATCKGVDNTFSTGLSKKDVASSGENNAKVAMLYWYICKNKYAKNIATEEDKVLAATFIYNSGPGTFNYLWDHFKATSYEDFEKKLSTFLVKKVKAIEENKLKKIESKGYGVKFRSLFEVNKSKKMARNIKIGGKTFDVWKLIDPLHYVRIIEEIRHARYLKTGQKKTPKRIAEK